MDYRRKELPGDLISSAFHAMLLIRRKVPGGRHQSYYQTRRVNGMLGKPGPFQVIEDSGLGIVDDPVSAPRRRFSCSNYDLCLNLAAALNWDNFTCRGCSGQVDESLLWRARQAMKRDMVVRRLCDIPEAPLLCKEDKDDPPLKRAAKQAS